MSSPTCCIVLTGSELTQGATADRNGSYLAARLTTLGIDVRELRLVPDDRATLSATFREVCDRFDLVLLSGGLGPTADDLTVAALAGVAGREVIRDPVTAETLLGRATRRYGSPDRVPANFLKQAEVVAGAQVLPNPVGQAPGSALTVGRALVVVLPGVPAELRALYLEAVAPLVADQFALRPARIARYRILGLGESVIESRIDALGLDLGTVEYGISARPGECLVKLVARDDPGRAAIDGLGERLRSEFGDDLVVLPEGLVDATGTAQDEDHARLVHDLLVSRGVTVATAESCTGGMLARRLTDNAGSSAYFLGSLVAYHDSIKERLLGVDPALLASAGAVSAEVCTAMAGAVRARFGADYGVAVSGIAGPGGGSDLKPVGLVYLGLGHPDGRVVVERQHYPGGRAAIRAMATMRGLDLLRRAVQVTPRRTD